MTRSRYRRLARRGAAIAVLATLAACATQPVEAEAAGPPGFLYGLFHGFILLFAFVGTFFTDYAVYAYPNAGWPYDLGFLIGVMVFFGGAGGGGSRKR